MTCIEQVINSDTGTSVDRPPEMTSLRLRPESAHYSAGSFRDLVRRSICRFLAPGPRPSAASVITWYRIELEEI